MSAKTKVPEKKKVRRVPLPSAVVGFLNRNQVCEALGGVSIRTLNTMIAAGQFPRADVRIGRLPRWTVPVVNDWCRERAEQGASPGGEG